MWLFLSRRFRTWLFFALVLPFGGRLLRTAGTRVEGRNPRAGRALNRAGSLAQRRRR